MASALLPICRPNSLASLSSTWKAIRQPAPQHRVLDLAALDLAAVLVRHQHLQVELARLVEEARHILMSNEFFEFVDQHEEGLALFLELVGSPKGRHKEVREDHAARAGRGLTAQLRLGQAHDQHLARLHDVMDVEAHPRLAQDVAEPLVAPGSDPGGAGSDRLRPLLLLIARYPAA